MRILLSLLLFICIPIVSPADVVTKDPNTPESQQEAQVIQTEDPRLAQKINCKLGYTRLHTAVEEISKTTGVVIRCGKTGDDWHVRDIPVVVWVNDLPLGKVLETLALATHTQLTGTHIDGVINYRLARSSRLEKQMAEYEQVNKQAMADMLKWDWDMAVRIKDMPDSAFEPKPGGKDNSAARLSLSDGELPILRDAGQVLALLGPEERDRLAMGGSITLDEDSHPAAYPFLRKIAELRVERMKRENEQLPDTDPNKTSYDSVSKYALSMTLIFDGQDRLSPIICYQINMVSQTGDDNHMLCFGLTGHVSDALDLLADPNLPTKPQLPELPDSNLPDCWVKVSKSSTPDEPDLLKAHIKVEKPIDISEPTLADALISVAKSAEVSVISDDFGSHLNECEPRFVYNSEFNTGGLLRLLNSSAELCANGSGVRDWMIDESNRLILGQSTNWIRVHNSLVPEKLITELSKKLNGEGILLDDLISLPDLTKDQAAAWIHNSKELHLLSKAYWALYINPDTVWKAYRALDDKHRRLMKSEEGLQGSELDPAMLSKDLKQFIQPDDAATANLTLEDIAKHCNLRISRIDYPNSQPLTASEQDAQTPDQTRPKIDLHAWITTITFTIGNRKVTTSSMPTVFPIFSAKRLAELQQKGEAVAK